MLPSNRAGLRLHFANGGAWEGLSFNGDASTKKITSVVHYEDPDFSFDPSITSVRQLERMIRDKMVSGSKDDKTMNRMSMMNVVWAAFARAGGNRKAGLTVHQLKRRLLQWGVRPKDELMEKAFKKWGRGRYSSDRINFEEWRQMVVPGNYTQSSPISIGHIAAGNTEVDGPASEADVLAASMGAGFHAKLSKRRSISSEMKMLETGSSVSRLTSKMEVMEIVDVIRDKLAARVKPKYALDQAQKLFNCPRSGISKKDLKLRLNKWGLLISREQLETIFGMMDTEGTGRIALHDFCNFFMHQAAVHPLYKASSPATDTLDSRGRTLKFMRTQSGSMNGIVSPAKARRIGGKDFMAMTGPDITSAKTSYCRARCTNQRAKSPDVTEFIKRLLKNTLAAIEAYELDMGPSQYLESIFLHKSVHNAKTFAETVRKDFSKPLPMAQHLISATAEAYAFGALGKDGRSVNCKAMLRDAQLWEAKLNLRTSRERRTYATRTHMAAVRGGVRVRPRSAFAGSKQGAATAQRPTAAFTTSNVGPQSIMTIQSNEESTRRNSRRDELTAKMRQLEEKYKLSSRPSSAK
jgi:Ca2+-binding EF-hand superfamily protein